MEAANSIQTSVVDVPLRKIYIIRAAAALTWALVFVLSSSKLTTVTMTLLILYPGIDVVASIADARSHAQARVSHLQIVNASLSVAAVVAIAITSTNDISAVLKAFGGWALISGLIQLAVAVSRASRVGWQWAMLLSAALSTGAGLSFIGMAGKVNPTLHNVPGYAGLGAILFLVSAFLLGRAAHSSKS